MLLTIMAIVQTYYGTLPEERATPLPGLRGNAAAALAAAQRRDGRRQGAARYAGALGVNQQKLERLLWEIAWQAHSEALTREERADIKESEIMAIGRQASRRL